MKFKDVGMRAGVLRVMGVALAALVLASCGGGQQVEPFVPKRVLAFGDENSLIEANGSKYTINFKTETPPPPALDCTKNQIWVQALASAYALVFPQCVVPNVTPTSQILAELDVTSDKVTAQIDRFVATDSFGGKDLVTVLAGGHDILNQYALVTAGTSTEEQAIGVLQLAGTNLAGQVNRIAEAGGKVLIATVPDMGLTPFATNEKVAHPDAGGLLTRLTAAFNTKLRINLLNDGHKIGLLLADEMVQTIAKTSGWTVDKAACLTPPLATEPSSKACDTTTLVTGASGSSWLWADNTHMSSGGHNALGSAALGRAQGNPF